MTGRRSLTNTQILAIQSEYAKPKADRPTMEELAERFCCSTPTIQKAIRSVAYIYRESVLTEPIGRL